MVASQTYILLRISSSVEINNTMAFKLVEGYDLAFVHVNHEAGSNWFTFSSSLLIYSQLSHKLMYVSKLSN